MLKESTIKIKVGDLKKLIREAFTSRKTVGDYLVMQDEQGKWSAWTLDGIQAAGGTGTETEESMTAWAEEATASNDQYEDEWELHNDPDSYYERRPDDFNDRYDESVKKIHESNDHFVTGVIKTAINFFKEDQLTGDTPSMTPDLALDVFALPEDATEFAGADWEHVADELAMTNNIDPEQFKQYVRTAIEFAEADGSKPPMEEKKYPDTLAGAKQMLKDDSTLDHDMIDAAKGRPDPAVKGVWALYGVSDDEFEGPDAVVYLKGYPDPYGKDREYNDFELGSIKGVNY